MKVSTIKVKGGCQKSPYVYCSPVNSSPLHSSYFRNTVTVPGAHRKCYSSLSDEPTEILYSIEKMVIS